MKVENNCLKIFPWKDNYLLKDRTSKINVIGLLSFFLMTIADSCYEFYNRKNLYKFDPHIGDTLCQIRAYQIFLISRNQNNYFKSYNTFMYQELNKKCLNKLENLRNLAKDFFGSYNKELDKPETLKDFLTKQDMIFEVPSNILFLLQSYILTNFSIIDNTGISRGIDYEKFCNTAKSSRTFAKNTMHYFQKNISKLSCQFIYDISSEIPQYTNRKEILFNLQIVDQDKRYILPCFEVTKIILEHCLKNNIFLVLSVEGIGNFLYHPNKSLTDFDLCKNSDIDDFKRSSIVIKGISKINNYKFSSFFLEKLNQIGLKNVILLNMAKHRQYSSKLFDNPYRELLEKNSISLENYERILKMEQEYAEALNLAMKLGCCLDNYETFLIRHIYCDIIDNLISFSKESNIREITLKNIHGEEVNHGKLV
ncbi:MAG: hypothetical protein QM752_06370 [Gammaproteobacteria bacterium]